MGRTARGHHTVHTDEPGEDRAAKIAAVEQRFTVPLVNQKTGELLEPELIVVLDLIERDRGGQLVVVHLKTASRKYTDIQIEMSLQLSLYSYAVEMAGLADGGDVQLRFDVLTKTKEPELVRYRRTRDRAANLRLFRLADEVMRAIGANVFPPVVGWQCKERQFKEHCWPW